MASAAKVKNDYNKRSCFKIVFEEFQKKIHTKNYKQFLKQ